MPNLDRMCSFLCKYVASAPTAKTFQYNGLAILAVSGLLLTGCTSPFGKPSPLMAKAPAHIDAPSPGKSLVLIHRPRHSQGYKLYTGVWDSKKFIADLGNGHSVAYECEPGTHYFINRSVERVGVVEAQLLPDHTYGLWVNIAGAFVASFQIEPLKRGAKNFDNASKWANENTWINRAPPSDEHERVRQSEIELIMKDFISGEKKDRLRHLGPDDYLR